MTTLKLDCSGDLACEFGGYSAEVPKADGGRRRERGHYSTVWKHVGYGWRIAFDAFSGSAPP
jgi:ketosteroid isomerase-like protein